MNNQEKLMLELQKQLDMLMDSHEALLRCVGVILAHLRNEGWDAPVN